MSKDRGLSPRALDVALLGRLGQTLQGEWPLSDMTRLANSLAAPAGDSRAAWSAQGSLVLVSGAEPELWLALHAQAHVTLQCQRCLQLMPHVLVVDRAMRFVRDEDEAARLDEELDEDVLTLQPRLDLHDLFEDELILALPLVPMHEACPAALPLPADNAEPDEPAPNPFAALAALRGKAPH